MQEIQTRSLETANVSYVGGKRTRVIFRYLLLQCTSKYIVIWGNVSKG